MQRDFPIFVDMDGTLIKSDIAQELLIQSVKKWHDLKKLASLALQGRSHIKDFLARSNSFEPANLPLNSEVIDYLRAEKAKGRKVILATASDQLIAEKVAKEVGLFDDIIASTPGYNLKGRKKLEAIQKYVSGSDFEYLGDSSADIPIWKEAEAAGFVNASVKPESMVEDTAKVSLVVNNQVHWLKYMLKAMRPHQWAKNSLVFLPLVFSHSYDSFLPIVAAALTFLCFSLCASGIYLINDLLDIESDRAHPTKYKRPFAAGNLSPVKGILASFILTAAALSTCVIYLNLWVLLVLILYILLTNLYSFYLKHYSTIDVVTLTCLFTMRIVAGAVAVSAPLSPWLLNFSLFFFLSLAYMKRYIELNKSKHKGKLSDRNYNASDLDIVLNTGLVNGGLAVLTLSMYLNSQYVVNTYASPEILWFICPLMLFWIYRAWLWAKREKIDHDPVVFALKDKISWITVMLLGLTVMLAKYISIKGIVA
jgi:4-hydroxybenzoate polyprenyltransferase/phosphoserine phosphatase